MMDDIDRKLLTEIQKDFPRVSEPFKVLGEKIGISGTKAFERIKRLKEEKILRQISAIFDTRSLGYQSTLVAMKFQEDQLDRGAEIINQHPGVSHNYRRNDAYNLWFTIAVPPYHSLEDTIQKLHDISGALNTLILPTLKLFKIGMKLDLTGKDSDKLDSKEEIYDDSRRRKSAPDLTAEQIEAIRALQEDIPLVERPFEAIAQSSGFTPLESAHVDKGKSILKGGEDSYDKKICDSQSRPLTGFTEQRLFDLMNYFEEKGYFRRFAGILHHRKAGFSANAMVVWNIPDEKLDEVGPKMAQFPQVSHCYKRPIFPDFPYAIYTMIHGAKTEDCDKVIQKIIGAIGEWPRKNLYSTKEYKKIRLRYFTRELDEWWDQVGKEASIHPPPLFQDRVNTDTYIAN